VRKTACRKDATNVALTPFLFLVCLAGCGGEPFKLAPVSGKVTYTDGSLIPGDQILVRFVPEQPPTSGNDVASAATGDVNPQDGTFPGVTSHKYLDGAVVGRHKVTVIALKMDPNGTPVATKAVPEKYRTLIPEYVKDYVSLNRFAA